MPERVWLYACQEGAMAHPLPETCDRCPARAVWLWLTQDLELATCGHHGRQHGPALKAAGFDRYELAQPVSA